MPLLFMLYSSCCRIPAKINGLTDLHGRPLNVPTDELLFNSS